MKSLLRSLLLSVSLLFLVSPLLAITPEEAAAKVGETVTVTGTVTQANTTKSGAVYINFGDKYPKQVFSVYVAKANAEAFKDLPSMAGKTYTFTGIVVTHGDKPEIQIKAPEELVEATPSPAATTPAPAEK